MRVFFFALMTSLFYIVTGCQSQPISSQDQTVKITTSEPASLLIGYGQKINGILELISQGKLTQASSQLNSIRHLAITDEESVLYAYALATLQIAENNTPAAYLTLTEPSLATKMLMASNSLRIRTSMLKAEILVQNRQYLDSIKLRIDLAAIIEDKALYLKNHQAIWDTLGLLSPYELDHALQYKNDSILQQWLSLAGIIKESNLSLNQQINAIQEWQSNFPSHPAALTPLPEITAILSAARGRPEKIAILLPFDGNYRSIAEAIRDGFMKAYYKESNPSQLLFYSVNESQNFTTAYAAAIQDGADMVIGPLLKKQLEELYKLDSLPVTTIALNRLDQSNKIPANLFEFSLAPEDEITEIIKLATEQNRHSAIIIAQQDNWTQKNIDFFINQWTASGNTILNTGTFNNINEQSLVIQSLLNIEKSNQRARELQSLTGTKLQSQPRTRQDVDMIMMFAKPEAAISLRPLLSFHYANDIPVYSISSIYRGYPSPSFDNDLNDICFTDIPLTLSNRDDIIEKFRTSPLVRMYAFGFDAFQLSERIELMKINPDINLYGATGLLALINGEISRKPSLACFIQGEAKVFPMISGQK